MDIIKAFLTYCAAGILLYLGWTMAQGPRLAMLGYQVPGMSSEGALVLNVLCGLMAIGLWLLALWPLSAAWQMTFATRKMRGNRPKPVSMGEIQSGIVTRKYLNVQLSQITGIGWILGFVSILSVISLVELGRWLFGVDWNDPAIQRIPRLLKMVGALAAIAGAIAVYAAGYWILERMGITVVERDQQGSPRGPTRKRKKKQPLGPPLEEL